MSYNLDNVTVKFPNYTGEEHCVGMDLNSFYQEDGKYISKEKTEKKNKELKELCSLCPTLIECGNYAIKHERYGFWGGMSEEERDIIRKKNKIVVIAPEIISKNNKRDY